MNDSSYLAKLKSAVISKDVKTVRRLIKGGTDVNEVTFRRHWESSLLHEAVISGSAEILDLLLKANADVDSRDMNEDTPLHLACRRDNAAIARALLKKGASVLSTNEDRLTPLDIAIKHSGSEVVTLLLREDTSKQLKLHDDIIKQAMWNGYLQTPDVLEHLINHGANVNHKIECFPFLDRITQNEEFQASLVGYLIRHGSDPFCGHFWTLKDVPKSVTRQARLHRRVAIFVFWNLYNGEKNVLCECRDRDFVEDFSDIVKNDPYFTKDFMVSYIQGAHDKGLLTFDFLSSKPEQVESSSIDQADSSNACQSNTSQADSSKANQSHSRNFQIDQSQKRSMEQRNILDPGSDYVSRLSHKCRLIIRQRLLHLNNDRSILKAIHKLPLPAQLVKYVAMEDLTEFMGVAQANLKERFKR